MTNWQIICSIRIAEQVHQPMTQLPSRSEGMMGSTSFMGQSFRVMQQKDTPRQKLGYSPRSSLKVDCRRHPSPSPPPPLPPLRFMDPSVCFGLADWTFQDHSLLIHKTYCTSDWIERSTGAGKKKKKRNGGEKKSYVSVGRRAGWVLEGGG